MRLNVKVGKPGELQKHWVSKNFLGLGWQKFWEGGLTKIIWVWGVKKIGVCGGKTISGVSW